MQPLCMIGWQLTADSSMHRSTRNCICITCIAERSKQFIHDNFYNSNFSHNVARKKCHWKNVHYIEFVQVSSLSKSRVAVVYAFPIAFLSFEPHCDYIRVRNYRSTIYVMRSCFAYRVLHKLCITPVSYTITQ